MRKMGVVKTEIFDTKAEAKNWAALTEAQILERKLRKEGQNRSFAETLERYRDEVAVDMKSSRWTTNRINFLLENLPFCLKPTNDVSPADLADWRDSRLKINSPSTVNRDFKLLSAIFTIAAREWGWCSQNPCSQVSRPKMPRPRSRIVSDDERELILNALGYRPGMVPGMMIHYLGAAFLLAIETAMRKGEMLSLRWDDVDLQRRIALLRDTKNGEDRHVPLSHAAIVILEPFPHEESRVFPINYGTSDQYFRRMLKRLGINDLHFHDTRHTACTILARKMQAVDLAKITGHKDLNLLLNTYYNPGIDHLVSLLD